MNRTINVTTLKSKQNRAKNDIVSERKRRNLLKNVKDRNKWMREH